MKRLVLMFVGLALLLGGGIYYVFGVHSPKRDTRLASEEIERWEVRAAKVRTCLLGATPASPSAAEAMAIRDLSNNPPEFKKCTALISELSRGNAEDTGLKEVESEWRSINSAASGVANSFSHLFDPGTAAHERAIVDLGDALDLLALRHRDLRNAAEMDPPASTAGPQLAKAELIPFGTKKRTKLTAWLRPSTGGMVVIVDNTGAMQQIVLVPGEAPKRAPARPGVRPSVTDGAWGMKAAKTQLAIGRLTSDGDIESENDSNIGEPVVDSQVLFAVGALDDGAIAYVVELENKTPLVSIGRTRRAGLVEAIGPLGFEGGTPQDAEDYSFAIAPPSRGLVAWSAGGKLRATIVRPNTPISIDKPGFKVTELGTGHAGQACLSATHGWVANGDRFISFDDNGATPHVLPGHELIGCDATSVLLRQAGHRYAVCDNACRIVELAAGGDAVPGLAGGAAIAVASRQHVIAVWREKAEPRYFALPSAFKPKLVHGTAKVIDVIGEGEDGLAIARIKL